MRAAVLFDGTDRLEVVDVEHDDPRDRENLVATEAVGLCHSDYHVIDGTLSRPKPMIPGHEAAGVVIAVGPKVTGDTQPTVDIPRYIDMMHAGHLDIESMITTVLTFDQVNEGFDAMARADGARTVIRF